MEPKVKVDADAEIIAAIQDGKIDGDIYADGEVWVDIASWKTWANDPATYATA